MMGNSDAGHHWTINGRHVLIGLGVFFGIIFAVNGFFLYHAVRTHSGVETHDAYRRGLTYNARIEASRQQDKLAWKSVISVDGNVLQVMFTDRAGRVVPGLKVTASIGRPVTDHDDRTAVMVEQATRGTYRADVGPLAPGRWLVKVHASVLTDRGPKVVYRTQRRLWLKP
jgi:nitrogen fixation protein FixH